MSNWTRFALLIAAVAGAASIARAAEDSAAQAPTDTAQIAALVKQLDSDSFAEREAASDKLGRIGRPAIEAVAEAALGDSLEVAIRSVDILKNMLKSEDEPTRKASKEALEKLTKEKRTAAAGRAARALKPAEELLPPGAMLPPAAQLMPGAAIQIAVAGGNAQKIQINTVNGVKTIDAEEADQKVKIVDDPNQGIKIEVTSKKNGKDVTENYEAKNAEALKKKHPEAYKIYNKYSHMGAGGGIFAVQMHIGGQAAPVPVQPPTPTNPIDTAARMLPGWGNALDRILTDDAIRQGTKESNEELKKKVGEFKEQLGRLEKRLQEAMDKAGEEP